MLNATVQPTQHTAELHVWSQQTKSMKSVGMVQVVVYPSPQQVREAASAKTNDRP